MTELSGPLFQHGGGFSGSTVLSNRPTKILLAVLEAHSLGDQGSEADSTRSAGCYKDCIFRNIISVPMKKNEKKEIRLALCFSHVVQ